MVFEGGVAAGGPTFAFYRDAYGGTLDAASFVEALPAALRCVWGLCGGLSFDDGWGDADAVACGRAACAACEAFAEFG